VCEGSRKDSSKRPWIEVGKGKQLKRCVVAPRSSKTVLEQWGKGGGSGQVLVQIALRGRPSQLGGMATGKEMEEEKHSMDQSLVKSCLIRRRSQLRG